VNLAARMESHGQPGRIQVSEAFHELTRDEFVFEARGTLPIKGVGEVRTYLLMGAPSAQPGLSAAKSGG
jgi:class 3 adenylate cyclase